MGFSFDDKHSGHSGSCDNMTVSNETHDSDDDAYLEDWLICLGLYAFGNILIDLGTSIYEFVHFYPSYFNYMVGRRKRYRFTNYFAVVVVSSTNFLITIQLLISYLHDIGVITDADSIDSAVHAIYAIIVVSRPWLFMYSLQPFSQVGFYAIVLHRMFTDLLKFFLVSFPFIFTFTLVVCLEPTDSCSDAGDHCFGMFTDPRRFIGLRRSA